MNQSKRGRELLDYMSAAAACRLKELLNRNGNLCVVDMHTKHVISGMMNSQFEQSYSFVRNSLLPMMYLGKIFIPT